MADPSNAVKGITNVKKAEFVSAVAALRSVVTALHNAAPLVGSVSVRFGRELRCHEAAARVVLQAVEADYRAHKAGSQTEIQPSPHPPAAGGLPPSAPVRSSEAGPSKSARRRAKRKAQQAAKSAEVAPLDAEMEVATASDAAGATAVTTGAPATVDPSVVGGGGSRGHGQPRDRERSPVPSRSTSVGAQSAPLYPAGSNVIITGLTEAKHNEKVAKVVKFVADKERYQVVIGKEAPILVKEINMRPSIFGPA